MRIAAIVALAAALLACGGGNADVAPPEAMTLPADAGCADLARVRPLCLRAAEARCASQEGDCEAQCEPRLGPGSSEKEPALRSDIDADRCRQRCRVGQPACRTALAVRCPNACEPEAGSD
ncbi:MAG TPA: hypothetical protein VF765_20415 [Polyangiaceae bacterium]